MLGIELSLSSLLAVLSATSRVTATAPSASVNASIRANAETTLVRILRRWSRDMPASEGGLARLNPKALTNR